MSESPTYKKPAYLSDLGPKDVNNIYILFSKDILINNDGTVKLITNKLLVIFREKNDTDYLFDYISNLDQPNMFTRFKFPIGSIDNHCTRVYLGNISDNGPTIGTNILNSAKKIINTRPDYTITPGGKRKRKSLRKKHRNIRRKTYKK